MRVARLTNENHALFRVFRTNVAPTTGNMHPPIFSAESKLAPCEYNRQNMYSADQAADTKACSHGYDNALKQCKKNSLNSSSSPWQFS